jgi:hypothetical protein
VKERGTPAAGTANPLGRDLISKLQQVEQLPDRVALLRRMTHLDAWVDRVMVTPPDPPPLHVAAFDEVYDDPLRRPLRDPDVLSEVTQPYIRVLRNGEKHLSMVRQEGPGRVFLSS